MNGCFSCEHKIVEKVDNTYSYYYCGANTPKPFTPPCENYKPINKIPML